MIGHATDIALDGPAREGERDRRRETPTDERILLVDDEPTFRTSTSQALRKRGFRCDAAADAHQARELLEAHTYAIVISDLRMPGNHDLEFVRSLCALPFRPSVILLTAYPSMESALSSVDLHLAGYLVKPVDLADLVKRIETALDEVRARRALERVHTRLCEARQDTQVLRELLDRTRDVEPDALRAVLDRTLERVVSAFVEPDDAGRPIPRAQPAPPRHPEMAMLTRREREVLEKLLAGQRVAGIAAHLEISPHTVRNHLKKIFRKLGVNSQVELVGRLNSRRDGMP